MFTLILDPHEVADAGRAELDLNSGPTRVDQAGIDWGDAAIQAYLADLAIGSVPVDARIPNRQITIPLGLGMDDSGQAAFDAARAALHQKVGLIQQQHLGWLKRTSNVGPLYADIVGATLTEPDRWGEAGGVEPDVKLVLEALPDFYGDEVALAVHTELTNPELIFTEAVVKGDYPGRLRLIVNELQGQSQLGLIAALRARYYDAAATAKLAYEAEALTPLDLAAVTALTGASGGSTVRHNNLSTNWTPVLSTDLAGTGPLTHRGSYQVWARVCTTSPTSPSLRFLYDVGDFTLPSANDPVAIPLTNFTGTPIFYLVNLGQIRIDKAPVGTHRWKGVLQAIGAAGGENVYVDKLYFEPLDDAAVRLRAPVSSDQGLASASARDEFNQTAGVLTGKALPVGGTWGGAGDTDDFNVSGAGVITRAVTGDTGPRLAFAGTPVLTNMVVQADVKSNSSVVPGGFQGVLARYVDVNNYLAVSILNPGSPIFITVSKVVAGAGSTIAQVQASPGPTIANKLYSVRAMVDASGHLYVWVWTAGQTPPATPQVVVSDPALATGGVLASGKAGVYDYMQAGAGTRTYDNFAAWVPTPDAVLFASRSAELRHDGHYRYDSTGVAPGPITEVVGDLIRVPESGAEARTVEVFIKASRGDLASLPDAGIDDISAQIKYRPVYLLRP
jgi:hypothetical protein